MKHHRNSQKRFYLEGYSYFITGVTQNRFPYFKEEIFCDIFLENLKLSQGMKGFELHGWFLGYDNFHLLLSPGDEFNISKIMQNLKLNASRDINRIMELVINEGEKTFSRLHLSRIEEIYRDRPKIFEYQKQFHQKYPTPHVITFPKFQWQRSFHDHVIRNEKDFENHMRYIEKNPIKHEMPKG